MLSILLSFNAKNHLLELSFVAKPQCQTGCRWASGYVVFSLGQRCFIFESVESVLSWFLDEDLVGGWLGNRQTSPVLVSKNLGLVLVQQPTVGGGFV